MSSMHWASPALVPPVSEDSGPIPVTIKDRVATASHAEPAGGVHVLERARRWVPWGIVEEIADLVRLFEVFRVDSRPTQLHQHERTTNDGRVVQEQDSGY
jgi:Transmembrane secretion effector